MSDDVFTDMLEDEIEPVPDGCIWCEHCGYNRGLTTDQLKELNNDVVEAWCPQCDEAILNHGSGCPDHIHLDFPLLTYQDAATDPAGVCNECNGAWRARQ